MRWLLLPLIFSGCYLSTPYEDCDEEVVAWVSYQGRDCPDSIRHLIPAGVVRDMRAHYAEPRSICHLGYAGDFGEVGGIVFSFAEGGPETGDEQMFDQYVDLQLFDVELARDVCAERWGLLFYVPPCDIDAEAPPHCPRWTQ